MTSHMAGVSESLMLSITEAAQIQFVLNRYCHFVNFISVVTELILRDVAVASFTFSLR